MSHNLAHVTNVVRPPFHLLQHLLVFHATTSGDDQRRHKTCCGITCCCKESATDFEVVRSHFPVHGNCNKQQRGWRQLWGVLTDTSWQHHTPTTQT